MSDAFLLFATVLGLRLLSKSDAPRDAGTVRVTIWSHRTACGRHASDFERLGQPAFETCLATVAEGPGLRDARAPKTKRSAVMIYIQPAKARRVAVEAKLAATGKPSMKS